MIFLVEYDRKQGQLLRLDTFDDSGRLKAEEARHTLEQELQRRGVQHEVVLLEAASEEALRKTHRRYFATATELARAVGDAQRQ
ncbi:MAG TPA: hypothetical protein VJS92_10520 [Candidatus Polarisedimenticolaceae bacterium]|nr:hypothetical protein [Candidatus Polarisedimenticolaceae bacterium]